MVFIRRVAVWTFAGAVAWLGCVAEPPTTAERAEADVSVSALEQSRFCKRWPNHPRCRGARCGDGVVNQNEACDDGNVQGGDGCSASCELDDNLATPGDDRPGYVICRVGDGPEISCGPDQGCCLNGTDADPSVPVCAAAMSDCEVTPAFETCDGHEDCPTGTRCRGTRFGNACGQGYYDVCHTSADCDEIRPYCDDGICGAAPATSP